MRRLGLLVIGVGAAVLGSAGPALAGPSPSATGQGPAAETACALSDTRLTGLTGLVAQSDGGYVVVNTSADSAGQMRVFYLDSSCKVSRAVPYPTTARDPEDVAVAPDGTIWVADIGDNSVGQANHRESIALWKVPAGGNPVIYRLTYPDGQHDAKALLIGADGTPIIVTKEPSSGAAQIYTPTAALQAGSKPGVPLKNVGSWKPTRTGTTNLLGPTGQILVTGAAQSPDRKRVALRTYSDAYEWDVPDGDIVKAITTGKPRITPLAGEPQGEAIAYSADGKSFLTLSNQPAPGKILRYQPASTSAPVPAAAAKSTTKAGTRPWYQKLSLPQIIDIVAGVGVLGLVLVVVGVIGIRQSRKARRNGLPDDEVGLPARGEGAVDYPPSAGMSVPADAQRHGRADVAPVGPRRVDPRQVDPRQVDPRQVDPRQVDPRRVDPRQQGRPAGAPPVPGDAQRPGRARVAPPAEPQRQGRATVTPPDAGRQGRQPDAGRQGRQPVPPANPRPGRPVQPGRGGGGGNVYGGGQSRPGYDQRDGRQEYTQPGYRPDHDGDGRYSSERI